MPLSNPELVSTLIAGAVQQMQGGVGVVVREIPEADLSMLLSQLGEFDQKIHLAYLLPSGGDDSQTHPNVDLAFDVESAERWRNERGLEGLIVVVARGDEPKLSSLDEFSAVTPRDLKSELVKKAQALFAISNDVQGAWWEVIRKDAGFSLADMTGYFQNLQGMEAGALKAATVEHLPKLGLLKDADFFNTVTSAALKTRVERHRDVRTRIRALSPTDRVLIKNSIEAEADANKRKSLQSTLQSLLRSRWSSSGELEIGLEDAERLLKAKTKPSSSGGGGTTRRPTVRADAKASESLVSDSPDDKAEAKTTLDHLRTEIDNSSENPSLRVERTRVRVADDSLEVVSEFRTDVLALVGKFLSDVHLGGLAKTDADDVPSLLRKFNPNDDIVDYWTGESIGRYIDALERAHVGGSLAQLFASYMDARKFLLPQVGVLTSEPLLAMTDSQIRQQAESLIVAYEAFVDEIERDYEALYAVLGSEMEDLSSQILLLDVILVNTPKQPIALLSPLHPLYLWPYATFAQNIGEQRSRLSADDLELIAEAAPDLPNFVGSLFIPQVALGTSYNLNAIGKLSSLPVYAIEPSESTLETATDGAIKDLVQTFLAFEPHAARSIRVALIDDPSIGSHLREFADLHDAGVIEGAHVIYFRTEHEGGINLGLPEDDEDRVSQLFSALSKSRRFSFEAIDLQPNSLPNPGSFHVAVVFDRSDSSQKGVSPTKQPIQPLTLPRRLRFKVSTETVELEPTPGGVFAAYDALAKRASSGTRPSYLEVHQEGVLRKQLGTFMATTSWLALMDKSIDRDLELGSTRVLSRRYGDRDLVVFARSSDGFRRPLREVVRQYNAYVTEGQLDDLLAQLSVLLDSGLSTLTSESAGADARSRTKGLLGTLIAAKWYRAETSSTRVLASLDGDDARRWMLRGDDPHRADLLGLSWESETLFFDVIEVKAVDHSSAEYSVSGGVISGPAICQVVATRNLLVPVFASDRSDELMTTPARREIVREHLFRELSKPAYSADERRFWSEKVQDALEGAIPVEIRCRLVDVRLGAQSSSLVNSEYHISEDPSLKVWLTQLNEDGVAALAAEVEPGFVPDIPTVESSSISEVPKNEIANDASAILPIDLTEQSRLRVFLGTSKGTYGTEIEAWYDPALPSDPLPNPHISITGETGSGKTQATKSLISELSAQGIPSLIFDFKDDYSTEPFVTDENVRLYDASWEGLPFNPLRPPSDPLSGRTNVAHYVHQISEILKRIYKLGDQQAYRLREGLKIAYVEAGIPWNASTYDASWNLPSFESLQHILVADKANEALLGRLSPIFDLGLFATAGVTGDLGSFLEASSVIRLSQLPGDEVKNAVAEFFLMAIYNHLIREPQSHKLQRLLVLDEAWRLVESPFLIPLMREGRAFGLGVIIATQFPRDLPEEIRGSTATRLYFSQSQAEQIREIQRTVLGRTSGSEADDLSATVRSLSPLSCILHNKQFPIPVRMQFKPYFSRLEESSPRAAGEAIEN